MMRRAALPFRSTEGFHPKPKMVFASALGLGIAGHREVLEVELDEDLSAETVRDRLAAQTLPGLQIVSVQEIDRRQVGQACRATYFLPLQRESLPDLPNRIAALLVQSECWIERTRPHTRRINLRPYVRNLELTAQGLKMQLEITPQGAARPEEVLQALGLHDQCRNGAVLERTDLELIDETEDRNPSKGTQ
jgi:radical SAM-linked protein